MEVHHRLHGSKAPPPPPQTNKDMQLRRGPWTAEEDRALINNIAEHGEGQWNTLARRAELSRTGKSCRLRWLNYLRPDVRRGNFTIEEQLLILELQSRWGNRWSKIARCLPHRTDNEIKNYWRTRVQKLAKQLQCDVNSRTFRDAIKTIWIPYLLERAQAVSDGSTTITTSASDLCASQSITPDLSNQQEQVMAPSSKRLGPSSTSSEDSFFTWSTPLVDDEINLECEIHALTSRWYDEARPWEFGQGEWASDDLQSDEYLWSMEENRTMQQQL